MSSEIEKIVIPLIVLIIFGALFIYISGEIPEEEFSKPFRDIGTIAIGGAILIIIFIIIVIIILIYSRAS